MRKRMNGIALLMAAVMLVVCLTGCPQPAEPAAPINASVPVIRVQPEVPAGTVYKSYEVTLTAMAIVADSGTKTASVTSTHKKVTIVVTPTITTEPAVIILYTM